MKKNSKKPYIVIVHYNQSADYKLKGVMHSKKPTIERFATLDGAFKAYTRWNELLKQLKSQENSYKGYDHVELTSEVVKVIAMSPVNGNNSLQPYNVVPINNGKYLIVDGTERGMQLLKEDIITTKAA